MFPTSASSVSVAVESSPVSFELLSSNESHNYVDYVGNYATGPPGPPGRVESQPWQSNASARAQDAAAQQTSPQHSAGSWLWECGESDWCWPWDAHNPLVGPMWLTFCMFVGFMLPSNIQCKTQKSFWFMLTGQEFEVHSIFLTINLLQMWWGPLFEDPCLDLFLFLGSMVFQAGVVSLKDVFWGMSEYHSFPELAGKNVSRKIIGKKTPKQTEEPGET